MISHDEAEQLLDNQGHLTAGQDDLGPVLRVYLDEYTGWPSFCTITSPLPDLETLVALHEADTNDRGITVPYHRDTINQAPRVRTGHDLSITEEDALFDYYNVPIEGVVPAVEHLGSVLVPTDHNVGVVEHDVDHPPGPA